MSGPPARHPDEQREQLPAVEGTIAGRRNKRAGSSPIGLRPLGPARADERLQLLHPALRVIDAFPVPVAKRSSLGSATSPKSFPVWRRATTTVVRTPAPPAIVAHQGPSRVAKNQRSFFPSPSSSRVSGATNQSRDFSALPLELVDNAEAAPACLPFPSRSDDAQSLHRLHGEPFGQFRALFRESWLTLLRHEKRKPRSFRSLGRTVREEVARRISA